MFNIISVKYYARYYCFGERINGDQMVIDIGNIKKEPLMQDPYVKEVYELACDKSLFYKSPEELRKKSRESKQFTVKELEEIEQEYRGKLKDL